MRSTRFQSQERFFHFASRIPHEAWNQLPMPQKWRVFVDGLKEIQRTQAVQWNACVVMGSHFHLLFSIPTSTENLLLADLEKYFSTILKIDLPTFEYPILCEQIRSLAQYRLTYKYIYRNPVEAQLCLQVQDYPWSSLREILSPSSKVVFSDSHSLIQNPFQTLRWLNSNSDVVQEKSEFFRSPLEIPC